MKVKVKFTRVLNRYKMSFPLWFFFMKKLCDMLFSWKANVFYDLRNNSMIPTDKKYSILTFIWIFWVEKQMKYSFVVKNKINKELDLFFS